MIGEAIQISFEKGPKVSALIQSYQQYMMGQPAMPFKITLENGQELKTKVCGLYSHTGPHGNTKVYCRETFLDGEPFHPHYLLILPDGSGYVWTD